MRRTWRWIGLGVAGFVLVFFMVSSIWWDDPEQLFNSKVNTTTESIEVHQHYVGNITVDTVQHQLSGTLQVTATNKSTVEQKTIYFHLYPNAFRNNEELKGEDWDYVLGKVRSPGWLDIHRVIVNGTEADFKVTGTILEVPLPLWAVNEEISVGLDFELQVPKNSSRLSYDEHGIWLGNWLPIVAEYDDKGWYLDPYYPIGDPFYSDMAHYDFEIEVPLGYQIASSGNEVDQHIHFDEDRQTYKVSARNVRDFALVIMDDSYKMLSGQVNGVTVNTWYRSTDKTNLAERLHNVGKESIEYFSKAYGDYPYKEFDIVRTGGFFGGMEYPGLVFIQGRYFEQNNDYGVVVVAHETAHQWWYGIVGNNEVDAPWMDESLTDYSTLRFLLDHYNMMGRGVLSGKEKSLSLSEQFERNNEFVGNSVKDFSNWDSYGMLVYYKGSMMFYELEQAIGLEKMNQVLSDYFNQYQYRNASDQEIIDVFAKHLGDQVRSYFASWLEGGKSSFVK